jgi:hypothetical protein
MGSGTTKGLIIPRKLRPERRNRTFALTRVSRLLGNAQIVRALYAMFREGRINAGEE